MKTKYKVTNVYNIRGESNHRTAEAALNAAKKREGDGWIVIDQDGNRYTMHDGRAERV